MSCSRRSKLPISARPFVFALAILSSACARTPVAPEPAPSRDAAPLPVPGPPPPRLPTVDRLLAAPPATVGMDSTLPARLDSIIRVGIAEGAAPGASITTGRYGRLVHLNGYGPPAHSPSS